MSRADLLREMLLSGLVWAALMVMLVQLFRWFTKRQQRRDRPEREETSVRWTHHLETPDEAYTLRVLDLETGSVSAYRTTRSDSGPKEEISSEGSVAV